MSLVAALADLTNCIAEAELAWRQHDYDGPYSAMASAERRADAAQASLADELGREQACAIRRALIIAAAATRADSVSVHSSHLTEHLRPEYTKTFIEEGLWG